jgi:hypothetical protein
MIFIYHKVLQLLNILNRFFLIVIEFPTFLVFFLINIAGEKYELENIESMIREFSPFCMFSTYCFIWE